MDAGEISAENCCVDKYIYDGCLESCKSKMCNTITCERKEIFNLLVVLVKENFAAVGFFYRISKYV
jgi:hypothetical protein